MLLSGCLLLFGFNLGDLNLLKGDENYYFSSSRRMIMEGDWITPRYHHHVRFEKPPFYYWVVAAFFKLFGVSWVTARATSVVFGSLTVLLVYLLSLRLLKKEAAYLAPIILATSFLFFSYSRLAVIDMTFLFLVTLSLFLFIKGEREEKRSLLILAFAPLGLSVLSKGPLGLIIFTLITLIYMITTKRYRPLHPLSLLPGICLLLLISLPWPILMYKIHGHEYLSHLWEVEIIDKAVGSVMNIENVRNLLWYVVKYVGYYIPVVLFTFAPWSLFLPFALFKKVEAKEPQGRLFILAWFWSVFIFFTLASFKHTHYMLLLSPPLAMIVANLFANIEAGRLLKKASVLIAFVTFFAYISFTGLILPSLDDGALKVFSLKLTSEINKQDQEVGIASRGFNLKKIGVHLNNLVSNTHELSGDDLVQYRLIQKGSLESFLNSKDRVFCFITKEDYLKYAPEELRKRLYILEKSMIVHL